MADQIRVVIVDDSAMVRRMISNMLARDPAIQVIGEARDGYEGIRLVESIRPDVVTMDVFMPGLDGLAATEHLMAYCPTPILVLTSSLAQGEVDITFKMLGAGALEVIEKPNASSNESLERATWDLIRRIKVLSRVKVVTHLRGRRRTIPAEALVQSPEPPTVPLAAPVLLAVPAAATVPSEPTDSALLPPFPLVVIGASTGGPRVIYRILSELPSDLPAAILVVQHIAEGFSAGMVEWLQTASRLPVLLGQENLLLRPGKVFIAPDQRDLVILPGERIHLTQSPLLIQRPSVDIAMQAAAEVFAERAIGVLLTGMGRDGAYGLLTIRRRGGATIAQDEQSSTIFGMPRAAVQLGAAQEVLTPPQIAKRLIELVQQRLPEQQRTRGIER
ncbi:MAG: chemotaxis-specific protein-glutamate methyltransferase CheB [Roseiflexaceae bacterium]